MAHLVRSYGVAASITLGSLVGCPHHSRDRNKAAGRLVLCCDRPALGGSVASSPASASLKADRGL
jgi:hypothetical protein